MKITVVADSHGSAVPLGIARMNLEKSDKIIFLGDFFDHEEKEYNEQKQNILNVIEFKKQNIEKVVVLIGNHDANYILPDLLKWQPEHGEEIENLILQNLELIDFAYFGAAKAGAAFYIFYAQLNSDTFINALKAAGYKPHQYLM